MKIKYVLTPRGIELRTKLTIDFAKENERVRRIKKRVK